MEIQEKIDYINSLDLYKRMALSEDLLAIVDDYQNSKIQNDKLAYNIVSCLVGMRSAFEESDMDLKLLDPALKIARKSLKKTELLRGLLNSALCYSNYYPKKYNKEELEKEISEI